jgi:hypothetical protein
MLMIPGKQKQTCELTLMKTEMFATGSVSLETAFHIYIYIYTSQRNFVLRAMMLFFPLETNDYFHSKFSIRQLKQLWFLRGGANNVDTGSDPLQRQKRQHADSNTGYMDEAEDRQSIATACGLNFSMACTGGELKII